ncbi:MAG: hypothetical protein FJ087_18925 [Deltaproteobacteria bacterium]|nr:hypothetical protein [Deltaproteobacteria bacterium]
MPDPQKVLDPRDEHARPEPEPQKTAPKPQPEAGGQQPSPATDAGAGVKARVASKLKAAGYEGGAAKLSPAAWKPPAPGMTAAAELREYLKTDPTPQDAGRLLARMEVQGRIGAPNAAEIRAVLQAKGPDYANTALAYTGIGIVGNGVAPKPAAPAPTPAPAKPAAAPAAPEKKGWGASVKGWFSKGAQAIGSAYDTTSKKVGAAYQKTKTALGNTWDVLSNSSGGYADGKLSATTDLDEIQDFLPQTQALFDLDESKKGANKVSVVFDTKEKVMTVTAASLAVKGISFKGLTTGPATVSNLFVRITNPGHLKGGDRLISKTNPDDMRIDVSIGALDAARCVWQSPKGPVSIGGLRLTKLNLWIHNRGGGAPFSDAKPDNLLAGFACGAIELDGVQGGGIKAESLAIRDSSVLMDQKTETVDVRAGGIAAQGATFNGNAVKEAEATDLKARLVNRGGGLVGMDGKPDNIVKAELWVGGARVTGLKTQNGIQVDGAAVAGVTSSHDRDTNASQASVAAAQVKGLNSKAGALGSGYAENVVAKSTGAPGAEVRTATVGGAGFEGLDTAKVDATRGNVTDLKVWKDRKGMGGSLGGAQATGVSVAGVGSADRVTVGEVSGSRSADGTFSAQAGSVGATGIRTKGATVDGATATGIGVKSLDVEGPEKVELSVANAGATGIRAGDRTVGGVTGEGLSARTDLAGTYWANSKKLAATDVDLGKVKARTAGAEGVSAVGGQGEGSLRFDSASATGVQAGNATVGEVGVNEFRGTAGADEGVSATAKVAGVKGLDAGGVHLDSATATGVRGGAQGGRVSGGADEIAVGGMTSPGADVKTGILTDVKGGVDRDRGELTASVGKLTAVDGRVLDGTFRHAGAEGIEARADLSGASMDASLKKADIRGLQSKNSKAEHVSVTDAGVGIDKTPAGTTLDVRAGEVRADRVDAAGGKARVGTMAANELTLGANLKDKTAKVNVDKLTAERVDWNDSRLGASIGSAQATGIGVDKGAGMNRIRVDKGEADRIRFATRDPGSTPATAPGPTTTVPATPSSTVTPASAPTVTAPAPATTVRAPATTAPGPGATTPMAGGAAAHGLDLMTMSREEIDHLKDADVRLAVPMREGTYAAGSQEAKIDKDQRCDVYLNVKDGVIQPEGTRIEFAKAIDGPLWTSLKGVYLEEGGKVSVDIRGFFDIDITKHVTKGLGTSDKDRKHIPLKLTDLMEALVAKQQAAAAAKAAGGGGPGGGSGTAVAPGAGPAPVAPAPAPKPVPKRKEKPKAAARPAPAPKPGLQDAFDFAGITGSASVGLAPGQVRMGESSVTLGQGGPQTNRVQVVREQNQDIVATFVEFLVSAFDLKMGATEAKGGATSATGARIDVKPGKAGGGAGGVQASGTVDKVTTSGVDVKTPSPFGK